jgi:two-component system sensor histidine kinase ChiS
MSSSVFAIPSSPVESQVLIALFDWARFTAFSRARSSREVFEALDEFYRLSENVIHPRGGRILKYLGDAGLAVFPEVRVDDGVAALHELKETVDAWLREKRYDSSLHVNCHFGEVTLGPIGGPEARSLDAMGENINLCFTMERRGFQVTPQVFRKLGSDARKRFHKYTPPIVYRAERA